MNYRWLPDYFKRSFDTNLEVHDDRYGTWPVIAFITWMPGDKLFVCRFMDMRNDEFPDGKTYKTERGAKAFCEKHLPVMWIHHCATENT